MSKVVFLSLPAYGHINFTLQLVQRMVSEGEQVLYYSTPKYKDIIEAAGAKFFSYHVDFVNNLDDAINRQLNNSLMTRFFRYDLEMLYNSAIEFFTLKEVILNEMYDDIVAHKPDYIIHDSCASWGKLIAEKAGIKAIACFSNFALNDDIYKADPDFLARNYFNISQISLYSNKQSGIKRVNKMVSSLFKDRFNVDSFNLFDLYNSYEKLNIVFTSPELHPYSETFNSGYKFIGPLMHEFYSTENYSLVKNDEPIIYVSLGTVFSNYHIYKVVMEALVGMKAQVIISLGKKNGKAELAQFVTLPPNFTIEDFVPQKEILSKADLFIFHGGTNGVNEALFFNVPMIAIPYATPDHFIVAEQIEKLKTGVYVKDLEIKSDEMRGIINEVLLNPVYKENCMRVGDNLRNMDGLGMAMQSINEYKMS